MDSETFDSTIRSFKNRTPFRPFTISLVNGKRLEVDPPEPLLVRERVGLVVGPGGIPSVFDDLGAVQVIGDVANRPLE